MRSPSIHDLPSPPPGKAGWPWTEDSSRLPEKMPNGLAWPRISIVTPSFNQGKFIEETIRSVLLQGYPDLEYIIIDGGSADNSVEIIKKYEPWLTYWTSEVDRGQSHAINKGFQQSTGEILAYLNSDDRYHPGALAYVISSLLPSDAEMIIGGVDFVEMCNDHVHFLKQVTPSRGPSIHTFPIFRNGRREDFHFVQPAFFWTRRIWLITGDFDETYHYSFDRQWCIRALGKGANVMVSDQPLSSFTLHPGSKTSKYQQRFLKEKVRMYQEVGHLPEFNWLASWLESRIYLFQLWQDYFESKRRNAQGNMESIEAFLMLGGRILARRARLSLKWLGYQLRLLTLGRNRG